MKKITLTVITCALLSCAAKAAPLLPYPGPLGLRWGQSPADVRSILANKMEFISEVPGSSNSYNTIDLRYGGRFADLPVAEALLKFHRGEFFYLAVTLQTSKAGAASKVYFQVIEKMRQAYGSPTKESKPPQLASQQSISDHIPLADKRPWVLPLLWNEQTRADSDKLNQLYDLHIRTGLWDPFAGWRFPNGVIVQSFIHPEPQKDGQAVILKPIWIFAKEDRIHKWRQDVHVQIWIPPRDF